MKRTLLIAFLGIFALCAGAVADQVKFAWDDNNVKSTGFGWKLFMSDQSGQYDFTTPQATIMWQAGQTSFTSDQDIPISGTPNQKVTKFFVLRAFDSIGESADSNEVSKDFTVPKAAPFSFTVTIVSAN